jgi:uncharacterized repeat protein (TIGR01451 family)
MPTQIRNQASIAFQYGVSTGTAVSNVATATLLDPLAAEKRALSETYRAGDTVTYVLSVQNNGTATLSGVTLADDLGTYTVGGATVTPLTYLGDAALYVNGLFVREIVGAVGDSGVIFTIDSLAPDSNANIVYNALVNGFAPLTEGSTITNTVSVRATGIVTPVTADETITVEDYADVRIQKDMSPDPVSDGDMLTYTFIITNYGNTDATNVVLTDAFDPAPGDITVSVEGDVIPSEDYTYAGGVLTLPTGGGTMLAVPAATVTTDPTTGEVTLVPGTLVITVMGTI